MVLDDVLHVYRYLFPVCFYFLVVPLWAAQSWRAGQTRWPNIVHWTPVLPGTCVRGKCAFGASVLRDLPLRWVCDL